MSESTTSARDGKTGQVPYEDLAPQDQVDRIAWEHNLDFDEALALWARRRGEPERPKAERPPIATRHGREWA